MGCVYEVEHLELGKRFVLKALLRGLVSRAEVVSRLRNEWRALGRLEHPNIVAVTDAGTTETDIPYYVMERLEGETLAKRLRRERQLHWSVTVPIILDVVAALSEAHRIGVIHRDIKPSNLFLLGDGSAKLLDFGIAKIETNSEVLTANGVALGTPRYMSPEQARGERVDGRADLYAVGLVFYEMLAGRGPFDPVRDANDLLLGHLARSPVPIEELVPDLPKGIARLVMSLLAKRPDRRPGTADEVHELLLQFVRPDRERGRPPAGRDDDPGVPTPQVRTEPIDPRSLQMGFAATESPDVVPPTEPLGADSGAEPGPMGTLRDVARPPSPPDEPPRGRGQTLRLSEQILSTRTSAPVARPVVSVTPPPVTAYRTPRPASTLRRDLLLAGMAMLGVVVVGFAAVGLWSLVVPDISVDHALTVPPEAGPQEEGQTRVVMGVAPVSATGGGAERRPPPARAAVAPVASTSTVTRRAPSGDRTTAPAAPGPAVSAATISRPVAPVRPRETTSLPRSGLE